MRPIGCPETSVRNYRGVLRNTPEERWFHRHRDGSLKSPNSRCFGRYGPVFSFWQRQRFFSSSKRPNRLCGPTQPSGQWIPAFFAGDKAVGCENEHSTQSSADIQNGWSYNSSLPPPICLHGVDRDNFTFFIVPSQTDVYVRLVVWGMYLETFNILFNGPYSWNIHGFFDSGYRAV